MSTAWPRWPVGDPAKLLAYVQYRRAGETAPATPADLLGLGMAPTGDGPVLDDLRALYEGFAARGISYADELAGSAPGRQTVRAPYEVLHSPRHATCLDLAVTLAGACLDAGLHPLLAVIAGRAGAPAHALVVVWLDGRWRQAPPHVDYRSEETGPDWHTLPEDLLDQLADTADAPGAFLALDITDTAARPNAADPRRRSTHPFEASAAHGARLLREAAAEHRLAVTLDVGLGCRQQQPLRLPDQPRAPVLAPPYQPPPADLEERGPLSLLGARHDAIRFHPRDELDYLRDFYQRPDPAGPRTRIAVLHGAGGAGKTRLAAELAHRLAQEGWYTGFLTRDTDPYDCAWLARVASPVLAVVDYAEDHRTADVVHLLRALRDREAPTCLLLTARSVGDWWEQEIAATLRRDGHRHLSQAVALPARHPRRTGVFRAALRSFGAPDATVLGAEPPPDPGDGGWSTLDLVMHAWLRARAGDHDHPTAEDELYERILDHELGYWIRCYTAQIGKPSGRTRELLREAGACISLLAPRRDRLDRALAALPVLAEEATRRDEIAALFEDLLPTTPEDGTLAVRPDPLATHLTATVLLADPDLLGSCLVAAGRQEQLNACIGITRVADSPHGADGARLAAAALRAAPDLWQAALPVAAAQGGPFVGALEDLVRAEPTSLPLAELAFSLPSGHSTLRGLALAVVERSRPEGAPEDSDELRAAHAAWLDNLAIRKAEAGEHRAAVQSATQAVAHLRLLARDYSGAVPRLASALTNLACHQAVVGERRAALPSAGESVVLFRQLAERDPATFRAGFAGALNNFALRQAEVGERRAALDSATEAVAHYRALAEEEPSAYLPDLAMALSNLGGRQAELGEGRAALESAEEAVALYQALAEEDPTAYLPALATALNGLAGCRERVGERRAAVAAATEAVHLLHLLDEAQPGAFRFVLATSLGSLAGLQARVGERRAGLESATEAVTHLRGLAQGDREAFLPQLAEALNGLGLRQAEAGERRAALESAVEAVGYFRALAQDDPDMFLPGLARAVRSLSLRHTQVGERGAALRFAAESVTHLTALSGRDPVRYRPGLAAALGNLSGCQANAGERQSALRSAVEALAHYRALDQADPVVFLPDLAMAVHNLSLRQAAVGERRAALESAEEAVDIRRRLVREDSAAVLPDLAVSLGNLASRQAEAGDRRAALETATEAVAHLRALAREDPEAFRPAVAMALTNLSSRQAETGDRRAALGSVTEAVAHYRSLAEEDPEAFLPDLAGALSNLAMEQGETGASSAALDAITEAVDIRRQLVRKNADAFLPALARELNNLSNCQSLTDDRRAALESVTEAVAHYEALALDNPAFLPQLAKALSNLAVRQGETGDRRAALESITECAARYRVLAAEEPAAFLPDLALVLNNLALAQGEAGDLPAAAESITEAVARFAALARESPEAFLSDLAKALNNLAALETKAGGPFAGTATADEVVAAFEPGPAAELLVARAVWRWGEGDRTGAAGCLEAAVRAADESDDPRWTGRARVLVRSFAMFVREEAVEAPLLGWMLVGLPVWATADLPEEYVALIDRWMAAETWAEHESVLRQAYPLLSSERGGAALDTMRAIQPHVPGLDILAELLQAAETRGLEAVLDEERAYHATVELVDGWLGTPDWAADLAYLRAHPGLVEDALAHELLAADTEEPEIRRHLGILRLAGHLPLPEVYDAVTDPATAVDTAMDLVGEGRIDALGALLWAAGELADEYFVGPYLAGVIAVCFGPEALESLLGYGPTAHGSPQALLFTEAAGQGTPVQLAGAAARLRALAGRRPQQAAELLGYADLLASAATDRAAE
ncbi:AAA family ATPase [Kitasatospora sp. NPDC097643]|uniref:P-loop NTPase n=1 Tax=Kitasatospora sp. NPDC097643 TaxID=3157230 RepID=UPI003324DFE0